MLDPKIDSLLQVYECGSFMAAAKKLSVTQPTVSHHIKALEEELHVSIFDRHSGKVIVTREGEEVIKCAKKMKGLYQSLRQDLRDSKAMVSHLTVGVTHTAEKMCIRDRSGCHPQDGPIRRVLGLRPAGYGRLEHHFRPQGA